MDTDTMMENNMGTRQTAQEMMEAADKFAASHRAFLCGELTEKALTDITTQPFWESLRLSRKRLDEKGIVLDETVTADAKHNDLRSGLVVPVKNGYNLVGNSVRDVWTERKFLKDGKIIYQKREREISRVGLLKSQVNGESALCPNCGHEDKISAYIDGCDYCGSKFLVSDFETKVSAYSLEENIPKKIGGTIKSSFLFLLLMTIFGLLACAVAIGLLVLLLATGNNGLKAVFSVILLLFSVEIVPIAFKTVLPFGIIALVANALLYRIFGKSITGAETVKQVIPEFSPEDFWQNLDYQLKNIYLAGEGQKAAFAACSVDALAADGQNVIDCTLTRLKFHSAREEQENYLLNVQAVMKLECYDGKRIKTCYERLELELFTAKSSRQKGFAAVREYKCPQCNSSIDIMQGGICEYCQTKLDYSGIGWMISDCEKSPRSANLYRKIQTGMIGLYILVLVFNIFTHKSVVAGDNWYDVYQDMQGMLQLIDQIYDETILPDAVEGVELTSKKSSEFQKVYTYRTNNSQKVMQTYKELLYEEKDYTLALDKAGEMVFYRRVIAEGEEGYIRITATYQDGEIRVELTVKDELEGE